MEEAVLLAEGLDIGVGVGLGSLELHVGISDLRDVGEPKDDSQRPNEDGNCKVNPLDVRQSTFVVEVEKDV